MLNEYMYSNDDVYVTISEKFNTFKYPYFVIFNFTKYKNQRFKWCVLFY